uniref:Receptor-type tyrosine-protein phosphatase-like n=1 Tax=Crassostrea virginica TaxID=6565 RepID=A0A8B8C6V9_CRAVI|nr:receptor-type tyrosine-protein phosphatase-like [Crassostrea virginica]
MRIHSTQNWHQVTVYQITSWGLMETLPPDTCALLDVIKIIQLDKSCGSNTDFVVLSRDGATGCGVFCAVYNALQQLQQDEEVDMFTIVRQLQSRRPEMISELSEYFYCYQTVKKFVEGM